MTLGRCAGTPSRIGRRSCARRPVSSHDGGTTCRSPRSRRPQASASEPFYRGFPDRAALLEELQRRGYELLLDALVRIGAAGLVGADAIEAYLHECLLLADQLVAMPLRGAPPLTDDAAVDAKHRILDAIDDFLAEGRANGSVYDDVAAIDVAVCGTLIATPLPDDADWPETARRHIGVFVRGLRVHPNQG